MQSYKNLVSLEMDFSNWPAKAPGRTTGRNGIKQSTAYARLKRVFQPGVIQPLLKAWLAGTAWEYTRDWFRLFPYRKNPGLHRQFDNESIVVKEGSWGGPAASARTAKRSYDPTVETHLHRSIAKGLRVITYR